MDDSENNSPFNFKTKPPRRKQQEPPPCKQDTQNTNQRKEDTIGKLQLELEKVRPENWHTIVLLLLFDHT